MFRWKRETDRRHSSKTKNPKVQKTYLWIFFLCLSSRSADNARKNQVGTGPKPRSTAKKRSSTGAIAISNRRIAVITNRRQGKRFFLRQTAYPKSETPIKLQRMGIQTERIPNQFTKKLLYNQLHVSHLTHGCSDGTFAACTTRCASSVFPFFIHKMLAPCVPKALLVPESSHHNSPTPPAAFLRGEKQAFLRGESSAPSCCTDWSHRSELRGG